MKLITNYFIDSAHQLPDSNDLTTKKCLNLHGHTWAIRVEIEGENNKSGMVIDFGEIKKIVNELDHCFINDIFKEKFDNKPTTAENIALYLQKQIQEELFLDIVTVWVCEGYKGENHSNWVCA